MIAAAACHSGRFFAIVLDSRSLCNYAQAGKYLKKQAFKRASYKG